MTDPKNIKNRDYNNKSNYEYLLELKGISKLFPGGVVANDNVNLQIRPGEVHALLGENGAGKSTLMNVLYGILQPDEGEIIWKGEQLHVRNPHDAIDHGIGMVHQHFQLVSALTVVENVILSSNSSGIFQNKPQTLKNILELSEKYNLQVDPNKKIWDLTVGQQQRVEIIKALYKECDLLILDEPTAVLTPQETDELFKIIRRLTNEGKAVVFISHKLDEVMSISDRITILRDGHSVSTVEADTTNEQELASHMVGREVLLRIEKAQAYPQEKVLEVKNLNVSTTWNPAAIKNLNLTVRAGEIYGIAGVDGNGQSELVKAILSIIPKESGQVFLNGQDITNKSTKEIFAENELGHIPEDRHSMGAELSMPLYENTSFYSYCKDGYCQHGIVDWEKEKEYCRTLLETYNVKAKDEEVPLSFLSGGNQQKLVVARELDKKPKLLIAVYPCRGVDVGATEAIHRHILDRRDNGAAVLLISNELNEIMSLSDRIGVMYEGQILGEFDGKTATSVEIGLMMAGKTAKETESA